MIVMKQCIKHKQKNQSHIDVITSQPTKTKISNRKTQKILENEISFIDLLS